MEEIIMKKFLSLTILACCLFCTQYGYSDEPAKMDQSAKATKASKNNPSRAEANNECPAEHPANPEDQATGECYCLYVRYCPRYYTTQKCVEEQIPCTKTCCREVPEQYEVKRCRMVPEYYTECCTRMRKETYEVPDCKTVKKMVCEEHCEYVPEYYWKHTCGNPCCPEKGKK